MTALKRLFSEGFRIFFLAAGLFAVLAMALWERWIAAQALGQEAGFPAAAMPQHWHAHEMIFGFGGAALAGFFLTAVPNWTGAKGAPHRFIALVAALWLAGRLALWFSGGLPPGVVALADLAFAPVLAGQLLEQLIRKPKAQQMILLALLALFWTANLLTHLEWMGLTGTLWAGLRGGLLTLGAMIMVLGGRVTPGFTRNAMVATGRDSRLPRNPAPLAAVSIAASVGVAAGYLAGLPEPVLGGLAVVAGLAGLARVALWRSGWTWDKPILWVLHLSYAANAAGFAMLGLAGLGLGSEIAALHLLGIGGVGGMTLAIMSRASLGHTGRPLVAPRAVALAYALLPLAALLRYLGSAVPGAHDPALLLAGGLWMAAFALFVLRLWPVWWAPRLPRAAAD